jgi:hypothetical protein
MMNTYNRTNLTIEQVNDLEELKRGKNNWRQRTIRLLKHPTDTARVISDGISYDQSMRVIADELKTDWERELSSPNSFVTN